MCRWNQDLCGSKYLSYLYSISSPFLVSLVLAQALGNLIQGLTYEAKAPLLSQQYLWVVFIFKITLGVWVVALAPERAHAWQPRVWQESIVWGLQGYEAYFGPNLSLFRAHQLSGLFCYCFWVIPVTSGYSWLLRRCSWQAQDIWTLYGMPGIELTIHPRSV